MSKKSIFVDGPIPSGKVSEMIEAHKHKQGIGAHEIFLGQVRRDVINGSEVEAINYTAYREMADDKAYEIRENAFENYELTCLHIYHSLGNVKTGEICFMVFVSSPHRKAAKEACAYLVDTIKKDVPIFGKEILQGDNHHWKENKV